MAKDLNRSIKIYIDNSDAMKKAGDLENSISKLRAELKQLADEGKKDSSASLKKEKELRSLEGKYKNYMSTVRETERVLKNLSGSTYKELIATRRILKRELEQEQRGTTAYTAKLKAYQSVQKQITVAQKEMNGQLGAQGTIMSRAANGFNKYFGMATTFIASITGISFTLRKLSQDSAQIEDVYADVMKTTGMTREAVGDLNDEFKKMDTRTAREELNNLAMDAGKLGLSSKKDVLDFVEAGNQINVALGEDLGEGAIRNIGKLTEVFKKSTKELDQMDLKERMLAIGSSINELGQSSTASEVYLVNFSQRLGGVASQAGISIQNILGYASALDQSGQAVEMSATALQKFIMSIMGDPAKFARIAGLEVEKFNKLLKTDTNEAIKTVLKSLSEKGGFQELIPVFQEMGLDGARAVGVLSSLATNIHLVDEAQQISNKAFSEGISLTNEYNVKNQNAQAELEKRRKAFKDAALELGERLNPALLKSTNYVTYLVKLLPGFLDFLGKYGKYILYLATAYAAYTAGVKFSVMWNTKFKETLTLNNFLLRAKAGYLAAVRIAMLAYNVVLGLVTGNFTRMRAAWKLLTASMATNPIGMIAVAATAAIAGIIKLVQWLNRTKSSSEALVDVNKRLADSVSRERAELDILLSIARNEKISKDERLKAIKKLNEISPEYLGNLSLENINTNAAKKSVEAYTKALMENAREKAIADATSELYSNKLKLEAKRFEELSILEERRAKGIGRSDIDRSHENSLKSLDKQISKIDKQIKVYTDLGNKIVENKEKSESAYNAKINELRNEEKILVDLESKHAELQKKQSESGAAFADIASFNLVSQQLENQREKVSQVRLEYEKLAKSQHELNKKQSEEDFESAIVASATADKDKYKAKLEALDNYILRERNKLLQSYFDKEINEQAYTRQLEILERERLAMLLEIYEVGSDKRIEIENLLIEHKMKVLKKIEDDERAHLERLQQMREAADKARAESNWKALKAIAKQNEENFKEEFERRNKQKAELVAVGMDFANEMGTLVAGAVTGNEDLVASSLKSIINMGLDLLKVQVQMAIAGATAQSLAQPDSVATFGISGLARAAVLVGLIEAAFAVVKGVIGSTLGKLGGGSAGIDGGSSTTQRVITQRAAGKYDVIGADDNRFYSGVPYLGVAQTGIIPRPALVGEYGPELIVSAPDFSRLQKHVNYPLVVRAIQESRVPQRASGNYSNIPDSSGFPGPTGIDTRIFEELRDLLIWLKFNKITAELNYHEFKKGENEIEKIKSKARRN